MLRLTRKGLWAHKVRFALTGLAVVLGVAFMAGTMILTDTMGKTFDELFATSNEGIDVVVAHRDGIEGEFSDVRERVDASVLEEIRRIDGVAAAAGSIEGTAQLVAADGSTEVTDGIGGTLGVAWIDDPGLNPFTLRSGRAPVGPSEVVLDRSTLEREGWALGDTVQVIGRQATTSMTIVGSAGFGEADGIPGFTVIAADDATAQAMFAQPGAYDSIVVAGDGGTTPAELAERIARSLADPDLEVVTGAADTAAKQASFEEDTAFFETFLMAFAFVALFVGVFIIHNTFSIVVAQRLRETALLRAIGASRGQVLRSVVLESAILGVLASVAGLGGGVAVSAGLRWLLAAVGFEIPDGDLVITGATTWTALVVGVGVTVVSSFLPALRASRVAPIAAMRNTAVDTAGSSVGRAVLGVALLGAGIAAAATGAAGSGGSALQLVGLGMLVTTIAVVVLGPVLARPVLHVLAAPARVSGAPGRLARENAKRNPRRSSATASALMVGAGLVGFITIVASSMTASMDTAVDASLRADFVVDSGIWREGGFATSIEDDLAGLPEVDKLTPLRSTPVRVEGGTAEVTAFDAGVAEEIVDFGVVAGAIEDLGGDGIALDLGRARALGVDLGDTVTVEFSATGEVPLTVRAIYDGDLLAAGGMDHVVDLATYDANVTDVLDRQIYLTTRDGTDAASARAAIESVLEAWPNAELQDQARFKESITEEIGSMLDLIYGLLALAVLIALIGIANTLALSVHERTREVGLLRAVGMTRRQLRTAIRWESTLIALLGTALGAILGIGGAFALTRALADEGVTSLVVPAGPLAMIVVLAVVAGVVAAAGPARRAARLDVLDAIATS